ncbi:hypothetical protein FCV43_05970 [Vibrio genomosp. F6]|uniref:VpsP family polysaccharide biosynthesis protein n=1 Tax=Vibrio genomosp. F6 TaxID=723172 RepID=UPI0010BDB1E3|nr:VpsP family polysaccharide biosynthesis protein [Vibrio genomosp. F6]TKF22560.1 hypothetical protein FCV43_05970 [Vibrio genomosp. F6]
MTNSKVQYNFYFKPLRWLAIFGALAMVYFSFCFGVASVYASAAEKNIERWSIRPDSVTLENVSETKTIALKAISLQPSHPHYFNILGKIYEWEAFLKNSTDRKNSLIHAKNAYLESASLRPIWPDTWADLIVVDSQLDSKNIVQYINKADKYGPFTPKVNQTVSQVGLINWQLFTSPQKKLALDHAARALTHPKTRGDMYRYLKSQGQLHSVCTAIVKHSRDYNNNVPLCDRFLQ